MKAIVKSIKSYTNCCLTMMPIASILLVDRKLEKSAIIQIYQLTDWTDSTRQFS